MKGSHILGHQEPDFQGLHRSDRMGGSFSYYVPPMLRGDEVRNLLDPQVRERALEASHEVERVTSNVPDEVRNSIYPLLLRSESIASSRIERINATARDVAYAALGDRPRQPHLMNHEAMNVSRNVEATRLAIESLPKGAWCIQDVERIHQALNVPGIRQGIRKVDVWIGRSSKVGADYVAPPPNMVGPLMDNLMSYINGSGENPLILAAVAHAQFESIHPFEDGNGRTGRALMHAILERGGVCRSGVLPISTVLRRRTSDYVRWLGETRSEDPELLRSGLNNWVDFMSQVAEESCRDVRILQGKVASMQETLVSKTRRLRIDSTAFRSLQVLQEQPVVTASFLAQRLGVTTVAAHNGINELVSRGVLVPGTGKYRKSGVFQAVDVLELLSDKTLGDLGSLEVPSTDAHTYDLMEMHRCGYMLPWKRVPCQRRYGHSGPHQG